MKSSIFTISAAVLALMSSAAFAQSESFCSDAKHSGDSKEIKGQGDDRIGHVGDVGYELWYDHAQSGSATFYSDGSMSCSFQGAKDYLCRAGLSLGSEKTYSQMGGDMIAEFKLVKQNVQSVDYSYVGVYGWMQDVPGAVNNLVEYYIVDNWLSQYRPGDWVARNKLGDYQIDGATYTVYNGQHDGPSITDVSSFTQYFSIRQDARDCGTINITAHMKKWEELGMKPGKLYEAKVLGEAGSNGGGVSGTADFPHAKVYVKGAATAASSSSAPASSSSEKAASSSSVAAPASSSSSVVTPAAGSSSSVATPAAGSSSSVATPTAGSSSSVATPVNGSSSGMAIHAVAKLSATSGEFQVFNMIGKYMGKVEISEGASLNAAILSKFGKAGVYMVKQGSAVAPIAVK